MTATEEEPADECNGEREARHQHRHRDPPPTAIRNREDERDGEQGQEQEVEGRDAKSEDFHSRAVGPGKDPPRPVDAIIRASDESPPDMRQAPGGAVQGADQ